MKTDKFFDTLLIRNMTEIEHLDGLNCKDIKSIYFILEKLCHASTIGKLLELQSKGVTITIQKNGETIIDDLLQAFDVVDISTLRRK